jgi:hypothetical protein
VMDITHCDIWHFDDTWKLCPIIKDTDIRSRYQIQGWI